MHEIDDIRRYVARRAFGAGRLLVDLHAHIEDANGAVQAGQHGVAVWQGRQALLTSASIRSLSVGGALLITRDMVTTDPYRGLPESEVAHVRRLVAAGVALLEEDDPDGWWRWLDEIRAHATETEAELGHSEQMHSVRSPQGMFPALRLARAWSPVTEALGLPSFIPSEWHQ